MSSDSRWDRMWSLFGEAAVLEETEQRAHLDDVCSDDPTLRVEIEKLLQVRQDPDALLETPAFGQEQRGADNPRQLVGTRIGPYVLTDVLGAGGMGVVYAAWQGAPLNRQVAVKLIKAGMDSRNVIQRFDAEREVLALMQHPAIAQVYDAGSNDQGRAYFVMEMVDGPTITEFCDTHKLDVDQRLVLFEQVCDGLEHAHQKGVIHRDIKPGNIMVTGSVQDCRPKIIDFGIAKVLGPDIPDQRTVEGMPIGTPQYMSPEQALGERDGMDTRSDIYSLGALLYRLLSGFHPLDDDIPWGVTGKQLHDMISNARVVAASRRGGPFSDRLRGDLDWIIQKAMAPERDRRYSSVSELKSDINRYRASIPVLASPPHLGYRMKKFVGRNRLAVTAGAAVSLALVLGIVGTTRMALEAQRQQEMAEQSRSVAQANAEKSDRVLAFLTDMLISADPWTSDQGPVTVSRMLDQASEGLDRFDDDPEVRDALVSLLVRSFNGLGEATRAEGLFDQAYADGLPPVTSMRQVEDQGHYVSMLLRATRYQEAMDLAERLQQKSLALVGPSHEQTLQLQRLTGNSMLFLNRYDDAEVVLRDNLRQALTVSDRSRETFEARQLLAYVYSVQAKWEQALALQTEAMEDSVAINGAESLRTLRLITSQGDLLYRMGKLEEAVSTYQDVIPRIAAQAGADHEQVFRAQSNLGLILIELGRFETAIAVLEPALDQRRTTLGPTHGKTLNTAGHLAIAYAGTDRQQEAEALRMTIYQERLKQGGVTDLDTLRALSDLALTDLNLGRPVQAEARLRQAWAGLSESQGESHQYTLSVTLNLARALSDQGRFSDASALLEEQLPGFEKTFPADHWMHLRLSIERGRALSAIGEADLGIELLNSGHRALNQRFVAHHPHVLLAARYLAESEGRDH